MEQEKQTEESGQNQANTGPNTGQGEPTPEEQQAYEKVVLAGTDVATNPKTNQAVMKMLSAGGDPANALAEATVSVVVGLDEKSGGKIPETVILPAAEEIMVQIAEVGQAQGNFKMDEAVLQKAMQKVVIDLAGQYGVSPEEVQAMMDQFSDEEKQAIQKEQSQYEPNITPVAGEEETGQPTGQNQSKQGIIDQQMRG